MIVLDEISNRLEFCSRIEFSVKVIHVETQTFKIRDEMVVAGILGSFIVNAVRGCLVVLHSDVSCVVYNVPRNDELAQKMLGFIGTFLNQSKCLTRRKKEMIAETASIQKEILEAGLNVKILGSYPLVGTTIMSGIRREVLGEFSIPTIRPKQDVKVEHCSVIKKDLTEFLKSSRAFLAKQARELLVVNLADMSGMSSKAPHTLLAATYLTGSSLKKVAKECLTSVTDFLESKGVEVLNYAVDGESLHLATTLSDGTPGTELSLAKEILRKLKKLSKLELVKLVSENKNINVNIEEDKEEVENIEGDQIEAIKDDIASLVNESMIMTGPVADEIFSLEDIEILLCDGNIANNETELKTREVECKKMKIHALRMLCLRYVFHSLKAKWVALHYGVANIVVQLEKEKINYSPHTVFEKNKRNFYRTLTFDTAHLSNLLRESAAKGKLTELGLPVKSLLDLSGTSDYSYLRKILSLKNGSLEYDPMNQASSARLFSKQTENGLRRLGDTTGANCCKLLREGIIEALDTSGISSMERCRRIYKLKTFLEQKIDIINKIKRPTSTEMTAELVQMIYCSLDSHIVSYLNIEFFNPRRKSTGSVEQFFSQITLMSDGGMKLNCTVLSDILERVAITNALSRLLPVRVKGFSFLKHLSLHMKSYSDKEDEGNMIRNSRYPSIFGMRLKKMVESVDSEFDTKVGTKRKVSMHPRESQPTKSGNDGNVRKFHRNFST